MTRDSFTVQKLLRLPVLQDAKVVGGFEGIFNKIDCVDIMEIPDITGWLRKGEFVLTTGYSFHGNPQGLCHILEEMHQAGGSAVGFKPKRFLAATPREAIELSNTYKIPLIEIPPTIPYVEITQPIMEQILNVQLTMLREVYDINTRFINLLATQRGQELLNVLGQLLGCEAALLTSSGSVEIHTVSFELGHVQMTKRITNGSSTIAHLALTRFLGPADVFESMCLDQVVSLMSLDLAAKGAAATHVKYSKGDFLVELLSGSLQMEGILVQRARQLGFPQEPWRFIMLIQTHVEDQSVENAVSASSVQKAIAQWINVNHKSLVAASLGDQIVLFYATRGPNQHQTAGDLARTVQAGIEAAFGVEVRIAIGEARQELRKMTESYEESKRALEVSTKARSELCIVHYSDICVEDMLLGLGQHPTLERLYGSLIHPILVYDLENGTDLLGTLDAYIRFGGNTKQVAGELFIHRNSVHYRIERIQDILGRNLNDPELCFRINLCLRAWKLGMVKGR